MNQAETQHENRTPADEPEPTWRKVPLAHLIIEFDNIIEYICADNGITFADHQWQTRRENPVYPLRTIQRWVDPQHHDTALDALEAINGHLSESQQLTDGIMELHASALHNQAVATKTKLRS